MKRLIVHIGNPKSGSTSLQTFMFDNRQALAEKGVLYPVIDGDESRSHSGLPKSFGPYMIDPRQAGLTFPAIQRIIAKCDAEAVILSSEHFINGSQRPGVIAAVGDLAASTGRRLTIAALVRPQHQWINSAFTQLTKRLANTIDFKLFCERSRHRNAHVLLKTFKPWMDIPGSEFIALPFTSSQLKPNLATAFLRACGLADKVSEVLENAAQAISNRSPGPLTIEASLRVARRMKLTGMGGWKVKKQAIATIGLVGDSHGWNEASYCGLTDEIKAATWQHFARANNRFARRVWGMDWDEVFAEEFAKPAQSNAFDAERCSAEDAALLDATVEQAIHPQSGTRQ